MKPPHPAAKEQQLLRNARREGLAIMAMWLLALLWSIGAGYVGGYGRDPDDIGLILGMPDWVFWAVAAPWGVCLVFSTWFCFWYVADDALGKDADEGTGHG
jgi:hypothetical protein